jgi:phage tail-like protein
MSDYFPPVGFHFSVKFGFVNDDDFDCKFQEVSGISAEMGYEELVEGGENRFSHRLPTRGKYSNLVLKRGLLTDSSIIDWCRDGIENFQFEPTMVNVTLLDEEHNPLGDTYDFINAWPVKWSVTDFKAMENSIVVESLELAYQYFTVTKSLFAYIKSLFF